MNSDVVEDRMERCVFRYKDFTWSVRDVLNRLDNVVMSKLTDLDVTAENARPQPVEGRLSR